MVRKIVLQIGPHKKTSSNAQSCNIFLKYCRRNFRIFFKGIILRQYYLLSSFTMFFFCKLAQWKLQHSFCEFFCFCFFFTESGAIIDPLEIGLWCNKYNSLKKMSFKAKILHIFCQIFFPRNGGANQVINTPKYCPFSQKYFRPFPNICSSYFSTVSPPALSIKTSRLFQDQA